MSVRVYAWMFRRLKVCEPGCLDVCMHRSLDTWKPPRDDAGLAIDN